MILLDGDTLPEGTALCCPWMMALSNDPDEDQRTPSTCGAGDTLAVLPQSGLDLRAHLTVIERKLVSQALHAPGWVVAHAARLLGLRRTTLVEKLRKLGLLTAPGRCDGRLTAIGGRRESCHHASPVNALSV